jgi:SAM-dependent methyltransferase
MLEDRTDVTAFDPHYTYHPAWAARIIARTRPARHVDVSSTLHFCTMISAFVPVEFLDIRPAQLSLDGLSSKRGDLMSLPYADGGLESISCMHVVEHVGLGRYGDPLDPSGDLKAMVELKRVLAPGGSLLFVVPVGKPCVRFNAHRIYSYHQIMHEFRGLQPRQFALIDDHGSYVVDAPPELADAQAYGCGCWWFEK